MLFSSLTGFIKKTILTVLCCAAVGFILLLIVFALPTGPMAEHVEESASLIEEEGNYPAVTSVFGRTQLDNFSDSLMLLNASYTEEEANLILRALNVYRPDIEYTMLADVLVSIYNYDIEPTSIQTYGRYWHGYLVVLKPLLLFFNYSQIRIINTLVLTVLVLSFGILLYRKGYMIYILPFLISLAIGNPFAIVRSLQFSTIYYISLISCIVFLVRKQQIMASAERLLLFFTVVGCATSYFDFLTYPLLTFGFPAMLVLASGNSEPFNRAALTGRHETVDLATLSGNRHGSVNQATLTGKQDPVRQEARMLIGTLLAWGCGYFGMWMSKWILATALGGENVLLDAARKIRERTSVADSAGNAISVFSVLDRNLGYPDKTLYILVLVYILIVICYALYRKLLKKQYFQAGGFKTGLLYIGTAALPFIWIICTRNHAYIHFWFTYREFAVTALALMCLATRYACSGISDNNRAAIQEVE